MTAQNDFRALCQNPADPLPSCDLILISSFFFGLTFSCILSAVEIISPKNVFSHVHLALHPFSYWSLFYSPVRLLEERAHSTTVHSGHSGWRCRGGFPILNRRFDFQPPGCLFSATCEADIFSSSRGFTLYYNTLQAPRLVLRPILGRAYGKWVSGFRHRLRNSKRQGWK